jgi:hypothetical protein
MVTTVTSITGGKDHLIEQKGKGIFKAFLDETNWSETWKIEKAYNNFKDPRRNSRIHKILIHKYVDTEYSIWIDGNIKLLISPEEIIERYLKHHDFAVFKHPTRDCLYKEAMTCATLKQDDPEIIIEQAKYYEDQGFPKEMGLAECNILIRRHTKKVEAFNNAWWAEYARFSRRDQISFMYAVDKVGLRVNIIDEPFLVQEDGSAIRDNAFQIFSHVHHEGNFNDPNKI